MADSRLRLLICSPGVPHESKGASTVLFYHYIDRLKHSRYDILSLLLLQSDSHTDAEVDAYIKKIETPGSFRVQTCTAESFVLNERSSIRLNTHAAEQALEYGRAFAPDVLFGLDVLSAWVLDELKCPAKLVWLGDLNFQSYWYNTLYAVKENWQAAVAIPGAWYQRHVWSQLYATVLKKVDSVIVSSKSSEVHLRRLGVHSVYKPYPWPNAVSLNGSHDLKHRIPSFLFFGSLTGLGSRSALRFMLTKLYARLIREWGRGGFQIFLCGTRNLPAWVERSLVGKAEIKYLGFVEDIDALMSTCHAVLVPIDVPVGNRSRIVTAMAKGSLVIAHTNASCGNPDLIDGETCYLASNVDEFFHRMQRAFKNPEEVARIVERAREAYRRLFEPKTACEMLVNEIENTIHRKLEEQKLSHV